MKLLQTLLLASALLAVSLTAQARSLLDGDYELQSWRINGQELSAKAIDEQQRPVTLSIKGGNISGFFSGCNRYMARSRRSRSRSGHWRVRVWPA